jgi:N-acetylglucosamine kinase-like BadF-type ATPase
MILVVDSGSTKTDWFAVDANGNILFSTQTLGSIPKCFLVIFFGNV